MSSDSYPQISYNGKTVVVLGNFNKGCPGDRDTAPVHPHFEVTGALLYNGTASVLITEVLDDSNWFDKHNDEIQEQALRIYT